MEIDKKIVDTSVVLTLDGKLNTNTSVDLECVIQGLPKEMKELVFDFKALSYLSSRASACLSPRRNASILLRGL